MTPFDMMSLLVVAGVVWIVVHVVQRRRAGSPMLDLSFSKNATQIGILLTIVAGIGAWSAISMDTGVATEVGRVNNLGLMASQQNQILLCGFLGVIGVLLIDLVAALAQHGVSETNNGIRNKMSRGSFTADYFLHCLSAMKVVSIRIVEPD